MRCAIPFHAFAWLMVGALGVLPLRVIAAGEEEPRLVVSVTGRKGKALGGAWVFRRDGRGWAPLGQTGSLGTFDLPRDPRRASWELAAHGSAAGPWLDPERRVSTERVHGTRVDLSIDCGSECTVDVVDAETGEPLRGASWRQARDPVTDEAFPWHRAGQPTFLLVGREGEYYGHLELTGLDEYATTHAVDSRSLFQALSPPGWVGFGLPSASVIRAVVPVRRAITLVVRPTSEGGGPAQCLEAACTFVGARRTAASASSDEPADRFELRVPYYRGATLTVEAWSEEHGGSATVRLPDTLSSPTLDVPVRLARGVWEGPHNDADFEGPSMSRIIGVGGGSRAVRGPSGSALELRVLKTDGQPLAKAEVWLEATPQVRRQPHELPASAWNGVTDAEGRVVFRELPPDRYLLRVSAPHTLPMSREVDLSQGGRTLALELKEPKGARLEVSVLNSDHRVVPFAAVNVEGPLDAHADVGVDPARVDPYTDIKGLRVFSRVEPGKLRVEAVYGPMRGETVVDVADGTQRRVTVVVSQPR